MKDALRFVESCIDRYAERAWRTAYVMLQNAADADDLLQQAFLVAWRKADSAPRDNPWPWLAAIIGNEARNYRRKRALRRGVLLETAGEPMSKSRPETEIERAELAALVHVALNDLNEEQRIAIVLTHLSGLSQSEAADALGVPLNTLKARVRRGLDKLRGAIGRDAPDMARTLRKLPVAAPPGGYAAAKLVWSSNLAAEVAAVSGAGAVGVGKTIALVAGTIVVVLGIVVGVVILSDQPEQRQSGVSKGTNEPTKRQGTRDIRAGSAPTPSDENEDAPAEKEEATGNQGAETREVEMVGPEPHDPRREIEDDTVRDRPRNDTDLPRPAGGPIYRFRDLPTVNDMDVLDLTREHYNPTSYEDLAEIKQYIERYYKQPSRSDAAITERLEAFQNLPTGCDELAALYRTELNSDVWQVRDAVVERITAEDNPSVLKKLLDLVYDDRTIRDSPHAWEHILYALMNHPLFAHPDTYRRFGFILNDRKLPHAIGDRTILELGRVFPDERMNRACVEMLIELLGWSLENRRKTTPSRNWLIRDALENHTGQNFGDEVEEWRTWLRSRDGLTLRPRRMQSFVEEFGGVVLGGYRLTRADEPEYPGAEVLFLDDFEGTTDWDPYALRIAEGFPFSFLSVPDCANVPGRSAATPDKSSYHLPLEPVARALESYRKSHNRKKLAFVARGVSGWIVMEYARLYPERVAFAVLGGVLSGSSVRGQAMQELQKSDDNHLRLLGRFHEQGDVTPTEALAGLGKCIYAENSSLGATLAMREAALHPTDRDGNVVLPPKFELGGWSKRDSVRAPVLFVFGNDGTPDAKWVRKDRKAIVRNFWSARWEDFDECGATPWAEGPEAFHAEFAWFLRNSKVHSELEEEPK